MRDKILKGIGIATVCVAAVALIGLLVMLGVATYLHHIMPMFF